MRTKFSNLFHFRKKFYTFGSGKVAHEFPCTRNESNKESRCSYMIWSIIARIVKRSAVGKMARVILSTENQLQEDLKEPYLKCRYVVAFLGFCISVLFNAITLNTSVTLVAMVNNTALSSTTQKSDSCPNLMANASSESVSFKNYEKLEGEFTWSPKLQGYILGSFSVGYIIFCIPSGRLSERFGCKSLLLFSGCVLSLATLLIPVVSRLSVYCFIGLQALRGSMQAILTPTVSVLAANWFPKTERGFLLSLTLSGLVLGCVAGSVVSGFVCEYLGWAYSFYVMGTEGLLLSLCIAVFLYDSPKEHPKISKAELEYILNNQENVLSRRKQSPPWRKLFSSVPVYALSIAMIGRCWAQFYFTTIYSTYLGTILHYSMKENGLLSAAPFLLEFVFSFITSCLSSYVQKTNCMSIDHSRKFWNFLACLGFSSCLTGIYLAGCNSSLSAMFGILSAGFKGLWFCGCRIVPNDMSPRFAGTLTSTVITFASLSGPVIALLIGYLTNEQQTIEQWNKLIFISVAFVMSTGVIFALFGSAEVQPWNYTAEEKAKNREDNVTRF